MRCAAVCVFSGFQFAPPTAAFYVVRPYSEHHMVGLGRERANENLCHRSTSQSAGGGAKENPDLELPLLKDHSRVNYLSLCSPTPDLADKYSRLASGVW